MNSEEFIEAVKRHVQDAAVEDTIENLKNPPGRRKSPTALARSKWYASLSSEEKGHVDSIVCDSVRGALFGMLVVLDGSRKISEEVGRFELAFVADDRIILNDPQAISLHDLLNASG